MFNFYFLLSIANLLAITIASLYFMRNFQSTNEVELQNLQNKNNLLIQNQLSNVYNVREQNLVNIKNTIRTPLETIKEHILYSFKNKKIELQNFIKLSYAPLFAIKKKKLFFETLNIMLHNYKFS